MLACPEASVPMAPPMAAAFKKCLRLDPPPQTVCARSLMVHPSRLTHQTRCNISDPSPRVGEPALWSLLCRLAQAVVNTNPAEQKGPVLRGEAPALTFCYRATHGNSPVFAGSSCHLGRGGRSISAGSSGSSSAVWGLVASAVGAGAGAGTGAWPRAGAMMVSTGREPDPKFAGRAGGGVPPMGAGVPPAGVADPSSGGLSPVTL